MTYAQYKSNMQQKATEWMEIDMEKMLETVTRENCGRILKMLRNKFGSMTLEDFAKALGVSRSTVMRIEDGKDFAFR